MKIEIVKKLSVGKLIGNVKAVLPDSRADTNPVELGRVVGVARGIKVGESQFGPWKALTGDFVYEPLVGPNKGKRFRSGTLFLPDVALDLVAPTVENLARGEACELAFVVTAKNDETVTIGYSYGAQFLMQPSESDPLEALMAKALPAPSDEKTDTETGENKVAGKAK